MCAAQSYRKLWTRFLTQKSSPSHKIHSLKNKPRTAEPFRGRILGIDPSLRGTGLAVIDVQHRDSIELIFTQTVKLSAKEPLLNCVYKIFSAIQKVIEHYQPKVCAAEQTIYVQNFQTAQIMGIARGVALAAIAIQHLQVFEYAPLRIKQAICGYGRASKAQVSKMVQAILKIYINVGLDETDAAAAAICCFFTESSSLAEIE
ncbi:MAG: crossover junction endodeoxyribonuclease RuvC [Puniceicoccales bacterium]|jgi:crossover junction endodeoxyribonuclease RuvC|nr:crossover junction endodeoxyribonuclease RuvC [Puniceicoccales bacterium]